MLLIIVSGMIVVHGLGENHNQVVSSICCRLGIQTNNKVVYYNYQV